ncbi:MAG: DUF3387 domain-containing protein [Candidatus Bathyarchaeota archaeon]|nr:DUF3387 domain-containing protein [Candidatus Bathyarchaeota archaeon]
MFLPPKSSSTNPAPSRTWCIGVVDSVKKNLQLDWTKKEDERAAIRLAVKKELRGKVPFSELDNLLKEVIEQAEGQYRDWPMEA